MTFTTCSYPVGHGYSLFRLQNLFAIFFRERAHRDEQIGILKCPLSLENLRDLASSSFNSTRSLRGQVCEVNNSAYQVLFSLKSCPGGCPPQRSPRTRQGIAAGSLRTFDSLRNLVLKVFDGNEHFQLPKNARTSVARMIVSARLSRVRFVMFGEFEN